MIRLKTVNIELGKPSVHEALVRLASEMAAARHEGHQLLKIIHGYGSSGAGGDIRIAIQGHLQKMDTSGEIRGSIHGEDWSKSNEQTWRLISSHPDLKNDGDLGRRNRGITIVLL